MRRHWLIGIIAFGVAATAHALEIEHYDPTVQQEQDMRSVTGQLEELQHRLQQAEKKLERTQKDNDMRIRDLEKQLEEKTKQVDQITVKKEPAFKTPVADDEEDDQQSLAEKPIPTRKEHIPDTNKGAKILGSKASASKEHTSTAAVEKIYTQGLEALKAKDYPLAQKNFLQFAKQAPNHKLMGNNLYWLGESYYAQKNYNNAGRVFVESYKKYPNGAKAGNALHKLALSLFALKRTKDGCDALTELHSRFSDDATLLSESKISAKKYKCPAV